MSTLPTTEPDLLAAIAHVIEASVHAEPVGTVAYVRRLGDGELEVGLRLLDPELHPCAELRDFAAPADWWALGLVTHGTATFLDEQRTERIVSAFFCSRDGREVSLLRRRGRVQELSGLAEGRVPELVREALGRHP
jgi:hypothetical protein